MAFYKNVAGFHFIIFWDGLQEVGSRLIKNLNSIMIIKRLVKSIQSRKIAIFLRKEEASSTTKLIRHAQVENFVNNCI